MLSAGIAPSKSIVPVRRTPLLTVVARYGDEGVEITVGRGATLPSFALAGWAASAFLSVEQELRTAVNIKTAAPDRRLIILISSGSNASNEGNGHATHRET